MAGAGARYGIGADDHAASVDRGLAVPLYHQIYLQLRDEILSGARPHGTAIPTEEALSRSFGVSRITVRRALDELAQQHFVTRRRRTGTQVTYRLPVRPIEANIAHAVDSLVTFGRETRVTVLEVGTEAAREPVASLLGVDPGTRLIRAVRLRWLDDEPLGCTIAHLPERLGPIVTADALAESPLLALLQRAGLEIGGATQTIAAMVADPGLAGTLQIERMAPLLRITRAYHDASGSPLLLTRAFYRADRYQVRVDLQSGPVPDIGHAADR